MSENGNMETSEASHSVQKCPFVLQHPFLTVQNELEGSVGAITPKHECTQKRIVWVQLQVTKKCSEIIFWPLVRPLMLWYRKYKKLCTFLLLLVCWTFERSNINVLVRKRYNVSRTFSSEQGLRDLVEDRKCNFKELVWQAVDSVSVGLRSSVCYNRANGYLNQDKVMKHNGIAMLSFCTDLSNP